MRFREAGGVLVIVLAGAFPCVSFAQSINLGITNVPSAATRIVAVVDGGAIAGTSRVSVDFPGGTASVLATIAVPAAGSYRVRAIALAGGAAVPAVMRSGLASGISVTTGSTSASLALDDITATVDPATPNSGAAGSPARIVVNFHDPGRFLEGGYGRLQYSPTTFQQNMATPYSLSGDLTALDTAGNFQFAASLNLFPVAGSLYYQVEVSSLAFLGPGETPHYIWPDVSTVPPVQILITPGNSILLTINNIPANATRVVVVADGGPIVVPLRVTKDIVAGTGSAVVTIGVGASASYRLRAIAFTAGLTLPAVLRSGQTTVAAVNAPATAATITLRDFSVKLNPSTPAAASPNTLVNITWDVVDSGDFLASAAGFAWTAAETFSQNLGSSSYSSVTKTGAGSGAYQFSVTLPVPAPGLYFQLMAEPLDFGINPETPVLIWPNLQAGGLLPKVDTSRPNPNPVVIPTILSFSSSDRFPQSANVSVQMSDQSQMSFLAAASSDRGWLSTSGISDATPVTLQITATPQGLAPGAYQGVIAITASGATVSIPVNLTVLATRHSTDFRGIGRSDAVIYSPVDGAAYVGLSDSAGGFSYIYNNVSSRFSHIRSGYFDRDALADILLYDSSMARGYLGIGDGSGHFSFRSLFWPPGFDFVIPGDLNGDGLTDFVLYRSTDGTMYSAISNGDGTFHYRYALVSIGYTQVMVADFDGDGRDDVIFYRRTDGLAYSGLSDGAGGFTYNPLPLAPGFDYLQFGDFDGNGKMDLLCYNSASGVALIGLSYGSGFGFTNLLWSPFFTAILVLDLDGDGRSDIALYNKTTAIGYVGLSQGNGTFSFSSLFWGAAFDQIQAVDLNGDGKTDILIYNSSNGTVYSGLRSAGAGISFSYRYTYWGPGKSLAR